MASKQSLEMPWWGVGITASKDVILFFSPSSPTSSRRTVPQLRSVRVAQRLFHEGRDGQVTKGDVHEASPGRVILEGSERQSELASSLRPEWAAVMDQNERKHKEGIWVMWMCD